VTALPATIPAHPRPTVTAVRRGAALQIASPRGLEWNRVELPIANLPPALDGLKIIHLSDTHFRRRWWPVYDRIIEEINQAGPDLICFSGDFVNKNNVEAAAPTAKRFFEQLRSRLGTFAILGNHDGDLLRPHVATWNLTLLEHSCATLQAEGASIEIVGIVGVSRLDLDLPVLRALPPRDAACVRILICHFPDLLPEVSFLTPDLYLTGHTHGGQICLPGRIQLIRHCALPRKLCMGVHRFCDTWMVVNRGMGFSGIAPVRLFCPAEVVEIVLKPAQ
jgi:predicted MPP superfamily phosphohydrolase